MDDSDIRMLQLGAKGYTCSQILLIMGLEMRGEDNPSLVRAVGGLAYGCGTGQGTCGVLSGGACLLALYAGKGADRESASERLPLMLQDLTDWFRETAGEEGRGLDCRGITGEAGPSAKRCGPLVASAYRKAMEILVLNGFDPSCP